MSRPQKSPPWPPAPDWATRRLCPCPASPSHSLPSGLETSGSWLNSHLPASLNSMRAGASSASCLQRLSQVSRTRELEKYVSTSGIIKLVQADEDGKIQKEEEMKSGYRSPHSSALEDQDSLTSYSLSGSWALKTMGPGLVFSYFYSLCQ